MATRLLFSGSQFEIDGVAGDQSRPDATTLTDGRIAIVYEHGVTLPSDSTFLVLGTPGITSSGVPGSQYDHAATSLLNGGYAFVFTNDNDPDTTSNISYHSRTASNLSGGSLTIADLNTPVLNADIATLSSGWQIVVFERITTAANHDVLYNVVDPTGSLTLSAEVSPIVVEQGAALQAEPSVAASGTRALIVYEDGTNTTTGSRNISANLFDESITLADVGPRFTIADHAAALVTPAVAALADDRFVIVYTDFVDVWGRIYDPSTPGGAFLSDEFQIDSPGGNVGRPIVTGTIDGGFIVTWEVDTGNFDLHARRFDAHGLAFGDAFIVNSLRDDSQVSATITRSGTNVLIAWTDLAPRPGDPDPTSVQGQFFTTTVFDYDSAGLGDLDGNGRDDILFQNDTGNVAVWQTNGNGAVFSINSLGQRPAGYLIDGTGNFNSTPGDDILLRSSGGTLAIWPTAGIAAGAPVAIGNAPNTYHNAGIGDFTGDGQDDLLFRHDTGQIVSWAVANNGLSQAPQILGSTSLAYHIVGVDDFTGDHQSDILFRNDDGSIAIWQVANNQLLSAQVVGSTSTAYHVVSTGDFDGNGANDILFRGDNGELVEWLLDSSGGLLTSPTSIGTVAAQYHVDGTGDLNGDGRDDIIFRDANGTVVEWLMNGTSLAAAPAVMGTIPVDYAIAAHHFDVV